jgi:hypothetical protein
MGPELSNNINKLNGHGGLDMDEKRQLERFFEDLKREQQDLLRRVEQIDIIMEVLPRLSEKERRAFGYEINS